MPNGFFGGLRDIGRTVGEAGLAFTTKTPLSEIQHTREERERQREKEDRLQAQQERLRGLTSNVFNRPSTGVQPEGAPPQSQDAALAEIFSINPELGGQILDGIGAISTEQREDASRRAFELRNTPVEGRTAVIQQQAARLRSEGRDPADTLELLDLSPEEQNQALKTIELAALTAEKRAKQGKGGEQTAGQREFAGLTEGLTPEQIASARLIKLGLSPRAVGSAIQTITSEGTAEIIGDAEATIAERRKFGELTGSSRSKAIDKGIERIQNIDVGIGNIDAAIAAVQAGAGVGAIESKFPSIKAASVELDNIQGKMALDVIGAVTFGALSKGELDLAKAVALPTGLDGPQLIAHLTDKKVAQQKLRDYFSEQIEHLDTGGSVASFLRKKEREAEAGGANRIRLDAQGNIVQ
jgi:hypothetical protein